MATGSKHEFLLPSWRVRRVDQLRSVKHGSNGRWAKLLRGGQSLVSLLFLLIILRVFGQGLLMGVAGAALVLLLQEAADPTPLFWTSPWEAMQLLLSRARRVNHIWLHRTQELTRESIGLSTSRWLYHGGRIRFDRYWQQQAISPMDCRGCLARDRRRARESQTFKRMQGGTLPHRRVVDDRSSAYTESLARNRSAGGSSDRRVFRYCGARSGGAN